MRNRITLIALVSVFIISACISNSNRKIVPPDVGQRGLVKTDNGLVTFNSESLDNAIKRASIDLKSLQVINDPFFLQRKEIQNQNADFIRGKKSTIRRLNQQFSGIRNNVKVILSDRKNLLKGEPIDLEQSEIESFIFDGYRFMNQLAMINDIKPSLQRYSSKRLIILESLESEFPQEGVRIENGYTIVDDPSILYERRNFHPASDSGQQVNLNNKLHDVLVASAATRGVKVREGETIKKLFLGYLNSDNVDLKYFRTKRSSNISAEINAPELFLKKIGDYVDDSTSTIISLSYAFNKNELSAINNSIPRPGNMVSLADAPNISKIISNRENFIILMSLYNNNEKYNDNELIKELQKFVSYFPNTLLVSSTSYDLDRGKFSKSRDNIANEVDFFTILGPDFVITPEMDKGHLTLGTTNALANKDIPPTSYATPLLSVVIFNMWTINPWLTSDEIIRVLKHTSQNYREISLEDSKIIPTKESTSEISKSEDVIDIGRSLGYLINPDVAYEHAVGNLIARAKQSYYDFCGDGKISFDYDNREWKIGCYGKLRTRPTGDSQNTISKSQIKHPLSIYDNTKSEIYVSNLAGKDGYQVIRLNPNSIDKRRRNIRPKEIIIRNVRYQYNNSINGIDVKYQIEFTSTKGYKDITDKAITIKYENGKPFIAIERVLSTQPIS